MVCSICGKDLDESLFWQGHLDKKLNKCKNCLADKLNIDDPSPILQEFDVPYIEQNWKHKIEYVIKHHHYIDYKSILGRYLSLMNLASFKSFKYKDSDILKGEG